VSIFIQTIFLKKGGVIKKTQHRRRKDSTIKYKLGAKEILKGMKKKR